MNTSHRKIVKINKIKRKSLQVEFKIRLKQKFYDRMNKLVKNNKKDVEEIRQIEVIKKNK